MRPVYLITKSVALTEQAQALSAKFLDTKIFEISAKLIQRY